MCHHPHLFLFTFFTFPKEEKAGFEDAEHTCSVISVSAPPVSTGLLTVISADSCSFGLLLLDAQRTVYVFMCDFAQQRCP